MTADSAQLPAPTDHPLDVRLGRELGWLFLGVMIWMARLLLPQPPAPPELDPSWQQGLSYALAHGFQFGRDILFTFGEVQRGPGFSCGRSYSAPCEIIGYGLPERFGADAGEEFVCGAKLADRIAAVSARMQ